MLYKIYAYAYKNGWQLCDVVNDEEKIENVLNSIDVYNYDRYMVIRWTDRDEVVLSGHFDRNIEKRVDKGYAKRKLRKNK